MRWTLWIILVILCGIYENLVGMTDNLSLGTGLALGISGLALFLDYLKRRE